MSPYIAKPVLINIDEVMQAGVSNKVQFSDGRIFECPDDEHPVKGDLVATTGDGEGYIGVISESTLNDCYEPFELDLSTDALQALVQEVDHVESDNLTLCILTLKDGVKVQGHEYSIGMYQEDRKVRAYEEAIMQLQYLETYRIERLIAQLRGKNEDLSA